MLNRKLMMLAIFLVGLLAVSTVSAEDNSTGDFSVNQISAVEDNSTVGNLNDDEFNLENDDEVTFEEGWIDATEAYECLDEYRAEKGVWYWNYDQVTITYFNTNEDNQLKPYVRDAALEETAKLRAKELSEYYSHDRPDGTSCFTAFPDGLIGYGECISYAATGREATESWKEDPFNYDGQGHRRTMLSPTLNCIGIGAYRASNGMIFWAQSYGIRVAYMDNKTVEKNYTSLDSSKGTFADLNNLIQSNVDIKLEKDYVYYNDSSFIDGILIDKALTIDGCGHTIDAKDVSGIFNITSDNVMLKNIKFANGFSAYGHGALYSEADNLTFINCSFDSNFAYYGAAIYSNGGRISLIGCSFNDNYGVEGSLYSKNAQVSILNCSFNNNSAILYGTVTSYDGSISISNSSFSDNANFKGGAIYLSNCTGSIIDSKFNNNSAIYDGGALYFAGGNVSIQNANFTGNFIGAEKFANEGGISPRGDYSNGGAIFSSDGIVSLSECCFTDNAIYANYPANGGGLYSRNSNVSVQNCSFTGSHLHSRISSCQGGALYLLGGNVSVKGCRFNNNSGNSWGGSAIFLIANLDNYVMDCRFNDNKNAHALDLSYTKGTVLNCSFTDNDGAISSSESIISISDCNFTNNSAILNGGALYLNQADVDLASCSFAYNSASEYGGAIYSNYCNASFSACSFINGHATFGGALYLNYNNVSVSNNLFNNNDAVGGGAVYTDNGNVTLMNSVFYNNTGIDGGATFNCNAFNCTFAENFASSRAGAMYGINNTAENCRFIKNRAISDTPTYEVVTVNCTFEGNWICKYADFIYQYIDSSYYQGEIIYPYLYDFDNSEWVSNATVTIMVYNGSDLIRTADFPIDDGWAVDIPEGTYLFRFSVENQSYIVDSKEKSIEILKRIYADAKIDIENKTFSESLTAEITSNADGYVDVYLDDVYIDYFTVTANNTSQVILTGTSAGNHTLKVIMNPSDFNIYTKTFEKEFEIYKKPTQINLEVKNTTDDVNTIINVTASEDGILMVSLNGVGANNVYVIANEETQINLGVLNPGKYSVEVTFTVNENYLDSNASKTFKVFDEIKQDEITISENSSNLVVTLPSDATGTVTLSINGQNYTFDVSDGVAEVKLPDLADGSYSYTITYSGDDKYSSFASSDVMVVNNTNPDPEPALIIPDVSIPSLDGALSVGYVIVSVPGDVAGKVTLSIGGKDYVFDVYEGKANVTLPDLANGDYDYSITYYPQSKYANFTDSGLLRVNRTGGSSDNKPVPEIVVPPLDNTSGNGSVKVTLPSDATGKVTLTINGKDYSFPVENGVANVVIPDLGDGSYPYTITYSGDDKYSSFANSGILTKETPKVDPVIAASNVKVTYSAGSYYTIKVNGTDGKPADGAQIVITVNGKLFKTLTTTNGVAKFKITNVPGTYKMNITALGKSLSRTLTVKHLLTLKSVTVKKSAKKLVLTATLGKINNKYLKNKKVTFKFNGKKYTAKTNNKGVAKVTIKSNILKKLKVGKKVTYQATYSKDTVKKTSKIKK